MTATAMVLFAHGARDPRWAAPFQRLQELTQASMPEVTVKLAFLELMKPSLPELVEELLGQAHTSITLVPIFLGQGGHVLRDLPAMANQLRASHPTLSLTVVDAVGEQPSVLAAIRDYCISSL
ncbi:sirohydrochlorin chelatase [Undibacterium terreum]|uniref:Cobalamin biosynthesis protein CbiX n=1 Tax=Undibacterium terreum TaxID=1224302 RepID=A0A916UFM1_9BURK|nr:CbiX/SirB N-terminal domain-containing protein [Undibacterium terreum]GGC70231.1 cobalamin biosynthesis protein CbiX [Undibacterium terreum]